MKRVNDYDVTGDSDGFVLYEGEPFTGEVVEITPDGTMLSLITYVRGRSDGPRFEWYPNGRPRLEGGAWQGRAVGRWREWHPNGRLAVDYQFDERGHEIYFRRWDTDGTVVEDITYE